MTTLDTVQPGDVVFFEPPERDGGVFPVEVEHVTSTMIVARGWVFERSGVQATYDGGRIEAPGGPLEKRYREQIEEAAKLRDEIAAKLQTMPAHKLRELVVMIGG